MIESVDVLSLLDRTSLISLNRDTTSTLSVYKFCPSRQPLAPCISVSPIGVCSMSLTVGTEVFHEQYRYGVVVSIEASNDCNSRVNTRIKWSSGATFNYIGWLPIGLTVVK